MLETQQKTHLKKYRIQKLSIFITVWISPINMSSWQCYSVYSSCKVLHNGDIFIVNHDTLSSSTCTCNYIIRRKWNIALICIDTSQHHQWNWTVIMIILFHIYHSTRIKKIGIISTGIYFKVRQYVCMNISDTKPQWLCSHSSCSHNMTWYNMWVIRFFQQRLEF